MPNAVVSGIDKQVNDLEDRLDESGNFTNEYLNNVRALNLKQFMQMNMMSQLNKIAEIDGIEKGSKEYKELAMELEKSVYGASLYGQDYYDIQDKFAGTAVAPDMFKFLLDDECSAERTATGRMLLCRGMLGYWSLKSKSMLLMPPWGWRLTSLCSARPGALSLAFLEQSEKKS